MTRNELVASLVPSVAAGIAANPHLYDDDVEPGFGEDICNLSEEVADEMIRRGIVKVSEEAKEPA